MVRSFAHMPLGISDRNSKLLLNNAVSFQWLSPVRFENARLHLESACNQKLELILYGVV